MEESPKQREQLHKRIKVGVSSRVFAEHKEAGVAGKGRAMGSSCQVEGRLIM